MKLCLAGLAPHMDHIGDLALQSTAVLESFLDFQDNEEGLCKGRFFMLDSGAFSFMNGRKTPDWEAYIEAYIAFIQKHKITHYFELDLDYILGLERVNMLTRRMAKEVNIPPIPVWHVDRGKSGFVQMCKDYDYVAVGGLAHQDVPGLDLTPYLPWFIETAHANGTKIHGLGFTRFQALRKLHFDSVDSTSWTAMTKFHNAAYFDMAKGKFVKVKIPEGLRHRHEALARHSMTEWLKAQKWAEVNL